MAREFLNPDETTTLVRELNDGKTWAAATALLDGRDIDPTWLATQETPTKLLARQLHALTARGIEYQAELWRAAADPAITSVEPTGGAAAGGEHLVIYGSGFAPECTVEIGGVEADVLAVDPEHILVVTPPGAGAADVVVTNLNTNTDTSVAAYTYA